MARSEEERVQVGAGCFWTTFAGHLSGATPQTVQNGGGMGNNGSVGGSFWQLFDQMDFAVPSPIDILLEQRDCSVDALLREEDVIQELRARHRGLITRLSQPDAAAVLIDCITQEPDANSKPQSQPFVAVQLLTCDVPELFEAWVSPEHRDLLDRFWGYLEDTPSENTRWVLAGYFSTVAMVLLERYPDEVAEDLRRRGPDDMLDRLVARLDSRSIAELLACIAAAEWRSRIVFRTTTLVDRLLGVLHNSSASRESQEHAQLIISELLARGTSLCFAEELLSALTLPSVVEPLVQLMLSGSSHQAAAASAVLAAVAFHTGGGGGAHLEYGQSFSSLSPLGGPTSRRGGEDADELAAAVEEEFRELETPGQMASIRSVSAALDNGALDSQCTQLVDSVCAKTRGIKELLEAAVAASGTAPVASPPAGKPAAGAAKVASRPGAVALGNILEVVLVLTLLLKARRDEMLQAFKREDVLTTCMKLLIHRPWCTLLHNVVGSLFSEVLRLTDPVSVALVQGFSAKGGLLEMVIAEYKHKQQHHDPARPGRCHAGYFGHLQNLVFELQAFNDQHRASGGGSTGLPSLLNVAGWSDVVVPSVEAERKQQNEELGGGIPAEVRALATSGLDPASCGIMPFGMDNGSGSTQPAVLEEGDDEPIDLDMWDDPAAAKPDATKASRGGGTADAAVANGDADGATLEAAKAAAPPPNAPTIAAGDPPTTQKSCCVLL